MKSLALRPGDTIAFIAPSSDLAVQVPHRVAQAKKFFEEKGYSVKVYPSCLQKNTLTQNCLLQKVQDIHDAFTDTAVKAIICTTGGYAVHQLLEYLDYVLIAQHPKIFCGFSDITSLHNALQTQSNLVTFYGPSVLSQFGEALSFDEYTFTHFFQATTQKIGRIEPSEKWTDDKKPNWLEKTDLTIKRTYQKNIGYEWLRAGKAIGIIRGGCIPTLMHTLGTKYFPELQDAVLLLETPEGEKFDFGEAITNINAYLGALRLNGVFKKISGLVVGRGFGYTAQEVCELKKIILFNTRGFNFPILYGVDIGHSDPMLTIPLGVATTLDSEQNSFSIDESGVRQ